MDSFEKALQFVLENKINPLTQFMGKISKLDQELDTLNRMKEDIESNLGRQEGPGRRRTRQVDGWLKDVEQIEKKKGDIMNQINEMCTYESTDEVFEEVIKEVENHLLERPSSDDSGNIQQSKAIVSVKKTIGIVTSEGGNANFRDSTITYNIGSVQIYKHRADGEERRA